MDRSKLEKIGSKKLHFRKIRMKGVCISLKDSTVTSIYRSVTVAQQHREIHLQTPEREDKNAGSWSSSVRCGAPEHQLMLLLAADGGC
jgi:hypothetical protein